MRAKCAMVMVLLAAAGIPAAAADPCATMTDLDPEVITRLAMLVPVGDVGTVKALRYQLSDEDGDYGPSVAPDPHGPMLIVPRGFRKLHCRLMITTFAISSVDDAIPSKDLIPSIAECVKRSDSYHRCLESGIARLWPEVLKRFATIPANAQEMEIRLAQNAFDLLFMHEVAHLVLGHLAKEMRTARDERQAEFDADVYAVTFGSAGIGTGMGYMFNFGILAEVDALLPSKSDTHDSFLCRGEDARNMGAALSSTVYVMTEYARTRSAEMRPMLKQAAAGFDHTGVMNASRKCSARNLREIENIRIDLQRLASYLNTMTLPWGDDEPMIIAFLQRLRRVGMETDSGRSVKAAILSIFVRVYHQTSPAPVNRFIPEMLDSKDSRYFLAKDRGHLVGLYAISLFEALPKMARPNEDNARLHRLLDEAIYYNPYFEKAYEARAKLHIREGNCRQALARLNFPAGMDVGPRTTQLTADLTREVRAGGCRIAP